MRWSFIVQMLVTLPGDDAGGEGFKVALLLAAAAVLLLALSGSFSTTLLGVMDRVAGQLPG